MGACAAKGGQTLKESTRTSEAPLPASPITQSPGKGDDSASTTDVMKRSVSGEVWNDEDAPVESSKETDRQSHNHEGESKVAQKRRRRLSVSTVESKPPKAAMQCGELGGPAVDAQGQQTVRTKITKFNDPALELVDRSKGAVREVTLRMLKELFPQAEHYAVFGSPSYDIQRGFDNKVAEIGGVMPPGKSLRDIGVGYACKKGLKPESPNQDDFFIMRVDDWAMYGVFDGHGPCGHDVSAFVHKTLPFLIVSDPLFEEDLPATLRRAFWRVHHLIEAAAEQPGSNLDVALSGTTATVVVHRDNKLYVAHVGDSRSVIAQRKDGRVSALNLTIDHKPTKAEEKARIEASGGEVRRLEGDIPHRVFVKNRMYPGLAMSRAIGDIVGVAVGVTPDPDIKTWEITAQDKFFIIATDGVWEFISSQEAVEIVGQKRHQQVNEGAELLAYESWRRWVEEEENVVDDVTCIVVWLDHHSGPDTLAPASPVPRPGGPRKSVQVDSPAAANPRQVRSHRRANSVQHRRPKE